MKKNTPQFEQFFFAITRAAAIAAIGLLMLVLGLIFVSGKDALSWQFLVQPWNHNDITHGGIMPALVGSIYVGLGVLCVSFPAGVATAIYLTEFSHHALIQRLIILSIRNLAGVPSIIFGMFGLAVFVHFFGFGTSILSAILTLSVMTLPWVITSSVESLKSVPRTFRQSSLALGATQWQTTTKVVIPAAISGMITGSVVSLARALGETAPIIMVGATFYLSNLPGSIMDKFMALPYHTFILATQHASPYAKTYAAATALVLIVLTFILSSGAIMVRYYFRSKKDW